jgi:hypothetical protein
MDIDYPMAVGGDVVDHAPPGFVLVSMTPREFLESCNPLGIDVDRDDYVAALVEHIQDGLPIDAPWLSHDYEHGTNHDGRHRAHAAEIAGCERIPVFVSRELQGFFDWEMIHERKGC